MSRGEIYNGGRLMGIQVIHKVTKEVFTLNDKEEYLGIHNYIAVIDSIGERRVFSTKFLEKVATKEEEWENVTDRCRVSKHSDGTYHIYDNDARVISCMLGYRIIYIDGLHNTVVIERKEWKT